MQEVGTPELDDELTRARLAALVHSSADAITGATLDGVITDWNPAAERLYGYRADEVIGLHLSKVIPAERWPETAGLLERVHRGESVEAFETVRRTKDGREITVSHTISPVWNDAGEIIATSAILRDISSRISTEQALAENELLFRTAFSGAPIGMSLVAPNGKLLSVNAAVCSMLGYTEEELLARTFQEITDPDDLDPSLDLFRRALAGEIDSFELEKRYLDVHGRVVWTQLSASLIRDENGQARYFITQIQDITERRATEEALRRSEARYRALVEKAPAVIYTEVRLGEKPQLYVSPSIERMLGFPPQAFLNDPGMWLSCVHPDDQERVRVAAARTHETAGSFEQEYRMITADGRIVWVRDVASLVTGGDGKNLLWQGMALDITAQKEAQEALEESELRFRTAFDDAPIGMAMVRPDRSILRVNRALCSILGYSDAELLATTLRALTYPEDTNLTTELMQRTLDGDLDQYRLDKRYIRKDGRTVWADLSTSLVREDDGTPSYFISQIQDITARKEAEAERTATHQRTRQVLERISDGFYALDRDWCFTYVNEAAGRMLDRVPEELVGKNVWQEFAPAVQTELYATYHRAMQDGMTATTEFYYPPLDAWFDVRAYPSRDGLSVFFRDVTANKLMERELRESEAKFRRLVEQLPAVVYVLANDEYQTPVYFSPTVEEMFRATPKDMESRTTHWFDNVHAEDRDRVVAESQRSELAEDTFRSEYRMARSDGSYVWVQDECVPVRNETGKIVAWQGILLDISERVRLEQELRQALEAAQAANRARSQFLAMMSHELRTPMQAVLGYADLLLIEPGGSLTGQQVEDIHYIRQGAGRMISLVEQMLDLSRLEAGRLELAIEAVDLAKIIEQVRHDIAPQAAAKGLVVGSDLSPRLPPLQGDPLRLHQILLNLAGNAVKFTQQGSVTISASSTNGVVDVAVSDTGIGIAPDILPHVFEEFRQADSGMTRRHTGAGLGLAIAKRLAEQHGGRISAVSTPDKGSTFTLHLPAGKALDPQASLES